MKSIPLISIIIPMYNAAGSIERCILSVMNQTYYNIEVLVVDDGSTDNSGEIVLLLAEKFKGKLKYYRIINSGVSAARNFGISKAKGDYLAFVDADDTIEINMYKSLLELLVKNNADLVICGRTRIIDGKEYCYKETGILHFYDGKVDMRKLSNQFDLNILMNKLYSRKLWGNLQLPEKMSYAEDLFIVPDILSRSKHIVYTSAGYYHYYENLSSASFSLNEEKLRSDLIAKTKLYKYMLSKSVDKSISFDWLFAAYTRGWYMGKGNEKLYFYKRYISFYFKNYLFFTVKLKYTVFLLFPALYFIIKKNKHSLLEITNYE